MVIERVRWKRDTQANWAANNPILGLGEPGYAFRDGTNPPQLRIGDGSTHWLDLEEFSGAGLTDVLDSAAIKTLIEEHNLSALRPYHLGVSKMFDAVPTACDIVLAGDSTGEGQSGLSSDEGSMHHGVVRREMAAVLNLNGAYGKWIPAGATWYPTERFSANGGAAEAFHGISLRARQMPAGSTPATITVNCDRIKVYYRLRNVFASANIVIKLDGVTVLDQLTFKSTGTWCSTSLGHEMAVWDSGALTLGPHTLSIEQKTNGGANGDIMWDGAYFFNGDNSSGIRVWNASRSGATFATYNSNNDATLNRGYLTAVRQGFVKPSLWVWRLGINEPDPAVMDTRMRQAVADVWAACDYAAIPRCSQVFEIPPRTGIKTALAYPEQRAVYYDVGFDLNVAVWDWNSYMGDLADDGDIYGLSADGIHPNSTGQRMAGMFTTKRMLQGVPANGLRSLRSEMASALLLKADQAAFEILETTVSEKGPVVNLYYTGSSWPSRPTLPAGTRVVWWSTGYPLVVTAPPGALAGDIWYPDVDAVIDVAGL